MGEYSWGVVRLNDALDKRMADNVFATEAHAATTAHALQASHRIDKTTLPILW